MILLSTMSPQCLTHKDNSTQLYILPQSIDGITLSCMSLPTLGQPSAKIGMVFWSRNLTNVECAPPDSDEVKMFLKDSGTVRTPPLALYIIQVLYL